MNRMEPIEVYDSDNEVEIDRRSILSPAIHNVIAALGGYRGTTYYLGDEAYGCLKDLRRLLRKDDTDDERTVARIFWESRLLSNDLVPILLETAGKGLVEDKCAIACADLITAMTWPIDLADELKELDETMDKGADYTQLLQSHRAYKAALLHPGVVQALLAIILPCFARSKKDRKERDSQIINVVLHLFRNLAFIKDRPANALGSADQAEYSALQSKLITSLSQAHIMDLLLTIASNAAFDPFFNQWNVLVLEILYLLFRGVSTADLIEEQAKRSQNILLKLLENENKVKLENARVAPSRHSRFGTTLSVRLKPSKSGEQVDNTSEGNALGSSTLVLHRQQALKKETGAILDQTKKKRFLKSSKVDEIAREDNLSYEAKSALRGLARSFVETCFNSFFSSILKDIKSERPKITEKDHLRLLFVTKWFLEFFLSTRTHVLEELKKEPKKNLVVWDFSLIAEILERPWIVWILKRMRGAMEDKPKSWIELQAGIECLTQLLMLIDCMSGTSLEDDELNEAAELLQQQIVYNGEVLDISVDSLRQYKEGVQSLKYLDSSIRLGYTLLRMLEKWSKMRGGGEMYVRKKVRNRKRKSEGNGEDEDEQGQDEENERIINEIIFTFEAFELKFAHEEITHTLITYLARYEEFTSPDQLKRVVNLLHRQAVKTKAEGLFFKVSTLNLFKSILARQSSLPKDQPHKDLISLITFILKKFFKAVSEDPLLLVEAFYPKTRGRWKQHSSWEPERKADSRARKEDDPSTEVQVKKGFSWSEQLGIAIACLAENGQQNLVEWVKEVLIMVIGIKQRFVEETDGSSSQSQLEDIDEDAEEAATRASRLRQPSSDAMSKFEDYVIPYVDDEHATAATKNPHLKLVFRLIKFAIEDGDAEELQWYIPAAILPTDLQSSLNIINQYLEKPMELDGKKASEMLKKKAKRRRRREVDEESSASDGEQPEKVKKREKKQKEKQVYKSAQFIEDSDGDLDNDKAFWAREKALRERTALLAAEGQNATMRSSGTKKRRKNSNLGDARKRRKGRESDLGVNEDNPVNEQEKIESSGSDTDNSVGEKSRTSRKSSETPLTTPQSEPDAPNARRISTLKRKPRPKPAYKGAPGHGSLTEQSGDTPVVGASSDNEGIVWDAPSPSDNVFQPARKKGAVRMVVSDEDE